MCTDGMETGRGNDSNTRVVIVERRLAAMLFLYNFSVANSRANVHTINDEQVLKHYWHTVTLIQSNTINSRQADDVKLHSYA